MRLLLTCILEQNGMLTHVWDLVQQLKPHGYDVHLAVMKTEKPFMETAKLRDPQLTASVMTAVTQIPCQFYETTAELDSLVKHWNIGLIHAQSFLTFSSACRVSQMRRIPLVLTVHGVLKQIRPYVGALNHAVRIIAVGPAQARSLEAVSPGKVRIIANGVDTERFQPPGADSGSDGPLRLLWFGRTAGRMTAGAKALDQAIPLLTKKGMDLEAKVLGEAAGVTFRNMEVVGWRPNPIPWLQWSQVAAGHGRSLREAMACGNAGILLAANHGGLVTKEWFGKGAISLDAFPEYRWPEADPETIAKELECLNRDRGRLHRLRTEAREIAEQHFDVRKMVGKTLNLYREAVSAAAD
ncbi:glycosyltransferase involved in cell wall biosynthesis [Melghirimyces profundicolus]|uniref:Glycosyltransferase involved in cell wall biosynthesis n=1 Tax=Melghirimyces profundicolus TaxID=1242148 RepID=A0A2T6BW78_9BACL|nr:glycosyltransferase family 4 protein [Melghirimyces profundicolus]PTX60332.1 glycosyltransferase involved in cell wall biosynthesis [Melghirimyces profundicolus]